MAAPAKSTPRDAQVMAAILKDMGVLEYEPRLINQMLEFTYRYVTDVIDDAKVYSTHANKKNIDAEDVKLAVQSRMDHSFSNPPPRDMLLEIARQRNSQPLPSIKPYSSPRLPPDRYCLSAANYKLKSAKKTSIPHSRIQFGIPTPQRISLTTPGKSVVKGMGAGGSSGLTVMPKQAVAASQPTVTIISKPTVSTPKPTIRINTGPAGIGASGLAQMVTQTGASSSSSSSSSSLLQSATPSNSSTAQFSGSSGTLGSITINPLKRKAEDDDYDV